MDTSVDSTTLSDDSSAMQADILGFDFSHSVCLP